MPFVVIICDKRPIFIKELEDVDKALDLSIFITESLTDNSGCIVSITNELENLEDFLNDTKQDYII